MPAGLMNRIRPIIEADIPFLWQVLYLAAHVAEDNEPLEALYTHPMLAKYVRGWGRESDIGFVAEEPKNNLAIGASWVRLYVGEEKDYGYLDDFTPELTIGVRGDHQGKGAGTQLLTHLLDAVRLRYSAVCLTVRADNPAANLYRRFGFNVVREVVNRVGSQSLLMKRSFA